MLATLVSWGLFYGCWLMCSAVTVTATHCELVTVGDGRYNCTFGPGDSARCDIYCNDKYQGQFTCLPETGWTTPLPPCVKPKTAGTAAAGGCELVTVGKGRYNCNTESDGTTRCDIYCNEIYAGQFTCYPGRGWTRPLPPCVRPKTAGTAAAGGCELVTVGKGRYNCSTESDGTTRCDIYCNEIYAGQFTCYPGSGWTRPLPPCVRPKTAGTAAAGGCELVTVGKGRYNCNTESDGTTRCDIYCNEIYAGQFTCYPGKGWTRPLPPCVRPKITCGPNSTPSDCASYCPRTCNSDVAAQGCPAVCKVGCVCNQGFIDDGYGNCIPENACPRINSCGPNSIPSDCVFCEPTCRNPKPEACTPSCTEGCACIPGFIKDDNGNCIPEYQCPGRVICGPNSTPSDCASYCPRTCNSNPAAKGCPAVCKVGCVCNQGFIDDGYGNCIPENACPRTNNICGPNSIPSDCVFCEPTCRNPKPEACAQSCTKGCACIPGFIKDDYGNCIPEYQCPGRVLCGPNSTPSDCASYCPRTCNSDREAKACPAVCVVGCVCNKGFIDDGYGNCIPENACPRTNNICGPNSIPSDCVFCEPTCRNPKPEACAQSCTEGCACIPGFIKDDNGNCIPEYQCPGRGPCGTNEVPSDCVNPCNDCETRGNCAFLVCNKGCDCLPGYRRQLGICIPEIQCPPKSQ